MPNKYSGISQGINDAMDDMRRDREFNLRSELARDSNRRAEEQYQYGISRRPVQEQMDVNSLKQQGIQTDTMELNHDKARQMAEKEGFVTAMRYLFAGYPEESKRAYNSRGEDRITNIEQHPDDPDQQMWLIEYEDGKTNAVDPFDVLKKLGAIDDGKKKLRGSDVIPVKDSKGIARYQTPEGAIGMEVPPSELGKGRKNSTPAILQETDAIYSRLKKQNPKADPAELWLQAHERASQKGSTSIQDAANKFYQGVFAKLLPDYASDEEIEKAEKMATQLTESYVEKLQKSRGIRNVQPETSKIGAQVGGKAGGVTKGIGGIETPVAKKGETETPGSQTKTGSETFEELPDAKKYDGRIIRDTNSGKRYKSINGKWVEIK